MFKMLRFSILISFLFSSSFSALPEKRDLFSIAQASAKRVQDAMSVDNWFHYRNFGTWSYEGGTITRGLWELQNQMPDLELEPFLHSHLDFFMDTQDEFGYRILHNESLTHNDSSVIFPWLYSIGDNIGLFPIVYADRLKYANTTGSHESWEDAYLVSEVVDKYIYHYPWHLPDGTVSRPITWPAEGFLDIRGGGVWVDDMFMGNALLVEQALITKDVQYLTDAAIQLVNLANLLQNSTSGLFQHGYHYWTDTLSCCVWGRGNGWAFLALTEVLEAASTLDLGFENSELYNQLISIYTQQLHGLMNTQGEDGLWSNILTNSSTFKESSASAMFLTGMSRGVRNGWVSSEEALLLERIDLAWSSMSEIFMEDGTVINIIGGTGIKDRESGYTPESTDYEDSSPGIGNVLRFLAEMSKLQTHLGM